MATAPRYILDEFADDLISKAPPFSRPTLESMHPWTGAAPAGFAILESEGGDLSVSEITPDRSMCEDCSAEIHDPGARRYRYPFTNCTQCGPRYTIIRDLPYDRARTTMALFSLCEDCEREYRDSSDRRFHAEPIACPACGPRLRFVGSDGAPAIDDREALAAAVDALRQGLIIAVKGIGGFHLMCDATSEAAVSRLRQAKQRPHKPFAIMIPVQPIDISLTVDKIAECDAVEEAALFDPSRPIVLLRKRQNERLAPSIAPGLAEIGILLPYSPLHQLLLDGLGKPVVATSANVGGEPVLTDVASVRSRLASCFDAILDHNREIERPADDSVVRVIAGKVATMRLGRGIAPFARNSPWPVSEPILACGGHIKSTVAVAVRDRIVVSPHIGDMGSLRSRRVFEQAAHGLQSLHRLDARVVVHDAHPGFATSKWAQEQGKETHGVRHHHAHASALMGEHGRTSETLVFAWDGLGLGDDDTLWGGETLAGAPGRWVRVGSFRSFRLVGGDSVALQPWRSACAVCWEIGADVLREDRRTEDLHKAWCRGAGVASSSVGRLFDAAATLLGVLDNATYDGQAPALVEALVREAVRGDPLPVIQNGDFRVVDWEPLIRSLFDPLKSVERRASLFHGTLAATILAEAKSWRSVRGTNVVGLTGGVFQNRVLTEAAVSNLERNGFQVLLHEQIPANDGGLSFGQAVEYAARAALSRGPS